MTSEAKIKANRENAKKSTGPRSPAGKAASSRNRLDHGLCAETNFLPSEDPAEFVFDGEGPVEAPLSGGDPHDQFFLAVTDGTEAAAEVVVQGNSNLPRTTRNRRRH
jgi:hypothetical protein